MPIPTLFGAIFQSSVCSVGGGVFKFCRLAQCHQAREQQRVARGHLLDVWSSVFPAIAFALDLFYCH